MSCWNIVKVLIFSISFTSSAAYFLIAFLYRKKPPYPRRDSYPSLSIIIPCHNEEGIIAQCIHSVFTSSYAGKKEIIVVDDNSTDQSAAILSAISGIRVITNYEQLGKAQSLNRGIAEASGDLVAVVDGDGIISKEALEKMADTFSDPQVAACGTVVKVYNRNHIISCWTLLSQLTYSLTREILTHINANITVPGPLCMFRRDILLEINGFSPRGFSEDADVVVRLLRKGYKTQFCAEAVVETVLPYTFFALLRQRYRWLCGSIFLLRNHIRYSSKLIDVYTLPMIFFGWMQGVVFAPFIFRDMFISYKHLVLSPDYGPREFLDFMLSSFSLYGFFSYAYNILTGFWKGNFIDYLSIASTSLYLAFIIVAVCKYEKRIRITHIIPFFFQPIEWYCMAPVCILAIKAFFIKEQKNIWKKKSTYAVNTKHFSQSNS